MSFVKVQPHGTRSDQPGITIAANRKSIYVNAAAIRCLGLQAAARYSKVPVDLMHDEATNRASLTLNVAGPQTHYLTKMDSGGRIECAGFVRIAFPDLDEEVVMPLRIPAAWESRRRMLVFQTEIALLPIRTERAS